MAKKGSGRKVRLRVTKQTKDVIRQQGAWRAKNPKATLEERGANLAKLWYESGGLTPAQVDMHIASAYETDRGCVIVAAAIIDNEIEKLLRLFFASRAPGSAKVVESLFTSEDRSIPMLQGTSIKVKLAYVLGLIPEGLKKACLRIQHMRSNVFAHTRTSKFLKYKDATDIIRCFPDLFPKPPSPTPPESGFYITLDDENPKQSFAMAAMTVITGIEVELKRAKRWRPRQVKSVS